MTPTQNRSAWTCMICDRPVHHVGPSLLNEGSEVWLHNETGITGHLVRAMETVIIRSTAR